MCEIHEDDPEVRKLVEDFLEKLPFCQALKVGLTLLTGTIATLDQQAESVEELVEHGEDVENDLAFMLTQALLIEGNPHAGFLLLKAAARALRIGTDLYIGPGSAEKMAFTIPLMAASAASSVTDEEVTLVARELAEREPFASVICPEAQEKYLDSAEDAGDEPAEAAQTISEAAAAALQAIFDLPTVDEPDTA